MAITTTQYTDVTVQQGDDHPLVYPVLEAGVAQDCTGWTARAQVRTRKGDLLHTWSTTDGSAVCDTSGVSLLVDDSDEWEWRSGRFDIRATRPDGVRVVPVGGRIIVKALVTR